MPSPMAKVTRPRPCSTSKRAISRHCPRRRGSVSCGSLQALDSGCQADVGSVAPRAINWMSKARPGAGVRSAGRASNTSLTGRIQAASTRVARAMPCRASSRSGGSWANSGSQASRFEGSTLSHALADRPWQAGSWRWTPQARTAHCSTPESAEPNASVTSFAKLSLGMAGAWGAPPGECRLISSAAACCCTPGAPGRRRVVASQAACNCAASAGPG